MNEEISLEFNQFRNFGYLKSKIPNGLFLNLIEESEKFNINYNEFKTGLSVGQGIAKHMEIKDNCDELSEFAIEVAKKYDQYFNYVETVKVLNTKLNLKSQTPWFNYQKKHEFLPNHYHDGVLSYSGWIKIPYDLLAEQNNNADSTTSAFQFSYNASNGTKMAHTLPIDKTWEGYMIMFPSNLPHCVYPFYTSDGTRISFAGNIALDSSGVNND